MNNAITKGCCHQHCLGLNFARKIHGPPVISEIS
jgi:hypothetical protein